MGAMVLMDIWSVILSDKWKYDA